MSTTRPVLPMTGGCACGAIRYEITSFPLLLYSCHCTDCQTISGSAFALNMPVATQGFRIVTGQPKAWRRLTSASFGQPCGHLGRNVLRPESLLPRNSSVSPVNFSWGTRWSFKGFHTGMRAAL